MKFKLNGEDVEVDVPDTTPLLWVIREELGLTGTKFGCGRALCGACTVHVDGKAKRSCVTPVRRVDGHSVTTIEGLAGPDGALHPVQQAWIDENAPQCGYCQSGQIMSAVALLERRGSAVTDEEIDAVMSANICRCGTYVRIRKAIKRASTQVAVVPQPEDSHRETQAAAPAAEPAAQTEPEADTAALDAAPDGETPNEKVAPSGEDTP